MVQRGRGVRWPRSLVACGPPGGQRPKWPPPRRDWGRCSVLGGRGRLCAELKRYAARPRQTAPDCAVGADWRRLPRPLCELCGLPRPGVGRGVACGGGVALWVCGRAVPGLRRPVRGPPENRGRGSPRKSAGVSRAALHFGRAALRGWAARPPFRVSRLPFFPPHFAGPPAAPAAGWAAPSVPAAAPWFSCAASRRRLKPRFSPRAGRGTKRPRAQRGTRLRPRGDYAACGRREKTARLRGRGGRSSGQDVSVDVLHGRFLLKQHDVVCPSGRRHKILRQEA